MAKILSQTSYGYQLSDGTGRATETVVSCHGTPAGSDIDLGLAETLRPAGHPGNIFDGLLSTGRTVRCPWTGDCWGTNADPHGQGGHGLGGIDLAAPTGPVHLIGASMGGLNSITWGGRHVDRVASLTLISPVVDLAAHWDTWQAAGGAISVLTALVALAWTGDAEASKTATMAAVTAGHVDGPALADAIAPVADRITIITAEHDPVIDPAIVAAWAATAGITDMRVVPGTGHIAGYSPGDGWDRVTTLRQVVARA